MKKLHIILTLVAVAMTTNAQTRLPFQKKEIVLKSPTVYEKRILRYDPKSGEAVYYDPKPRVVALDLRTGKYGLRWIGYDGSEKTIVYQRPDRIDAVVSATVTKASSGQYIYLYKIQNLPSSGQQLAIFAVQTFADAVKPISLGDGYVGPISNNKEMPNGSWIGFGSTNFDSRVTAGKSIELKILSPEPPGLVECRIAGGRLGMIGVGEEPPQELENILPGYEAWPHSYTIGPVQNLKSLSMIQRMKYVLDSLPEFQKLGWITAAARPSYEHNLKRNDWQEVVKLARRDLQSGAITTELHGLISYMPLK